MVPLDLSLLFFYSVNRSFKSRHQARIGEATDDFNGLSVGSLSGRGFDCVGFSVKVCFKFRQVMVKGWRGISSSFG